MAVHDVIQAHPVLDQYEGITPSERAELASIFAQELARGWVPRRADLEDALNAIRCFEPPC